MIIYILFLFFFLGVSFSRSIIIYAIVFILSIILILIKYKKKIALLCACFCVLGVGLSYINFHFQSATYQGVVIETKENYFITLCRGEKLYTYAKDNDYEIGDILTIKGEKKELDFVTLESEFDFEEYLNNKGIYYQLDNVDITRTFRIPIRIKSLKNRFLSHFSTSKISLIKSILFTYEDEGETLGYMKKLHLGRLASASGIYIYAYLAFFELFIGFFSKKKKLRWLSLVMLAPYLLFTFPRFTVVRIFVIEIVRIINEVFLKKKFRSIALVGMAGIGFLLIDHHLAYQTSFILGFTLPFLMICVRSATIKFKRIKKKLIQLLFLQILFIPIELEFYHAINPLSMIMQTCLSPLFIGVGISSLLCFYGIPIYGLTSLLIDGLTHLLGWLSMISFEIYAPSMNGWWILVYYGLYIVICYYREIGFIPIHRFLTIGFLSGITFYFIPVSNLVTAQVSFINVGQGDSCLIRKGNSVVLIDTGGLTYKDLATQSLIPFMKKQRIYNIDLVITTHDDYDHSGAYDSLKENFYVKRRVTEAIDFPITVNGMTFNNYNNHISDSNEENDNSLVVGFNLMHQDFLIMGDAPISVENYMMKEYEYIPCDILKVGHHGSKTSTSDEFVKYLKPKTAIISAGKNNKYGHPHASVIKTLENNKVEILRTYEMGTITYRNYIFM